MRCFRARHAAKIFTYAMLRRRCHYLIHAERDDAASDDYLMMSCRDADMLMLMMLTPAPLIAASAIDFSFCRYALPMMR